MTRQISFAILISACAMLVMVAFAAYVGVQQTLLVNLDDTMIQRATGVMRMSRIGEESVQALVPRGDRYVMRDARGKTIERPPPLFQLAEHPTIVNQGFTLSGAGQRMRAILVRWGEAEDPQSISVLYATPAAGFERAMRRFAWTLMIVLGLGVTITGAVAGRVSEMAMRPLHATARTIGNIDERRLDQRIDPSALPRELLPVATRLNEMLQRLQRAFTQQRQFMVGAAHELRSPVAALRATLEVALQRRKDPAFTHVLEKCLASTRMLNRLADVLTEQLRDELPPRGPELELVDVAALLDECLNVAEPLAQEKQIRLIRTFPSELPVTTDGDRLSSIVMNLLSNAIEYTPSGGRVEIECACDGKQLVLTVQDTGVGIAAEHLPHVSQPFYRADGARRRNSHHLGLGLYLVKSHVHALGGTMYVSSQPAQGTAVALRFPARALTEGVTVQSD